MALGPRNVTVGGIVHPVGYAEAVVLRTPEGTAAGVEPAPPLLPPTPAQIGDMVLFSIGPNFFRPLLVVALRELGKVNGILFLDPDLDSAAPWVKKYTFSKPTKAAPYNFVENVRFGVGQGEWKTRELTVSPTLLSEPSATSSDFDPRMVE